MTKANAHPHIHHRDCGPIQWAGGDVGLLRRTPRTNFLLPSRPGSALRHWEIADCPEVADSVDARTCPQNDGLRYSPDDPHSGFGPVHTSLYVRVPWDWYIFLIPPERGRAETGGADQWVLKRRKFPGFAIVNQTKRPPPWDTHYHFSNKTLLSKGPEVDLEVYLNAKNLRDKFDEMESVCV